QRDGIRYAAYGLTEAQARLTPAASALSIGGPLKHVATMERGWIDLVLQRQHPTSQPEAAARYEEGFRLLPHETLAAALADYATVARDTEDVVRAMPDFNHAAPAPLARLRQGPWAPGGRRPGDPRLEPHRPRAQGCAMVPRRCRRLDPA